MPSFSRGHVHAGASIALAIVFSGVAIIQAGPTSAPPANAEALGAIVGAWQSDVVNGVSATSRCVWTPERQAVLCEQSVTTPRGPAHALNLYVYDAAGERYLYYGLNRAGDPMNPVALSIHGPEWIYGGDKPAPDGQTYRTINDFSAKDYFTWARQSTTDGKTWKTIASGRSKRV